MVFSNGNRAERSAVHGHPKDLSHMFSFSSKNGRKISNGDCALFQAVDAPPFIGKISYQIVDKHGDVKLGVSWLYRPEDVKLGKIEEKEEGPLPPNEIFYSFHKDEIPEASLLHPCKVAFLGKGVELPSGVSSFVCRRVYDITSKSLMWLTDRDYTNEHQEEVDELLNKTRKEMQAIMQSGGLSPTTVNVSAQFKASSDNIQNSLFSKGKKRERANQNNESPKRGHHSRPDNSDSGHVKQECNIRPEEIINITDKDGSLINSACVEQLVHLMQQNRRDNVKKGRDLVLYRIMLVEVIATTDQEDCLGQFVQSGGLSILDDWLQEAHRGKSGDSGSPKEGETSHEDLLLVILQALGRLPVDLEALKTCNVGKSVNHLRNHKNFNIHKKARCLVDTWKRRVDEEMKKHDTKYGSVHTVLLPCKEGLGDVVPEHGSKGIGSPEISYKGLASLSPISKSVSGRLALGDTKKGSSVPPRSFKVLVSPATANSSKDSPCKMASSGTTDLSLTTIKEEKSSSSSESQNVSQTCSSSHSKETSSVRKDNIQQFGVSSTSSKVSQSASLHMIPNKVVGSVPSGTQKESEGTKSLSSRSTAGEKDTHLVSEKRTDKTRGDGSQRLIVRLPNPSCSPTRSLNCGSNTDKTIPESGGPSPDKNGKHEGDTNTNMQTNAFHSNPLSEVNTGSLQSNGTIPLSANPVEYCNCKVEDSQKFLEMSTRFQISLSGPGEKKEQTERAVKGKKRKLCESVCIMEGVGEGCSGQSEATAVTVDECGINLLSSVIATKISKVEDGDVGKSGTTLLMAGEDNLGQDTNSRRHFKISSTQLDDEDCQNALDLKKDKGECDSMGEFQKFECNTQISNRNSDPIVAAHVGETEKGSFHITISEIYAKDLSFQHDDVRDGMKDCMPSNQGVEQSREVFCTAVEREAGLDSVSTEEETEDGREGHALHKIGELDNLGHTKLHVKDMNERIEIQQSYELSLKQDKVKLRNGNQGTVSEGYVACPTASDSDVSEVKFDNLGTIQDNLFRAVCQDLKEVGKEAGFEEKAICSKPCNEDAQGVSSFNEQAKNIGILDVKEQSCTDVCNHEDKGKDGDADSKHLPVARNLTCVDDSQETMSGKGKENEAERMVASGDSQEMHLESNEFRIVHKNNVTTEMGSDAVLDIYHDEMKVDIKEHELSTVPSHIGHAGTPITATVSSTCVTHQECHAVTPATDCECSDEVASSEQVIAKEVVAIKNNGSSIKDSLSSDTSERPDFDLNEDVKLDEAVQHEAMILTPACTSGLVTPIAVVAVSKGPFICPLNPVQSIGELGWRGSAATSAFRRAELTKTPEKQNPLSEVVHKYASSSSVIEKKSGVPLYIDLNVVDERALEEEGTRTLLSFQDIDTSNQVYEALKNESAASDRLSCSPVKSDLDLNHVNGSVENGSFKMPLGKSTESFGYTPTNATSRLPQETSHVMRDFDLNNQPSLEETGDEVMPNNLNGKRTHSSCSTSATDPRMNGELLNSSSWFSSLNEVQAPAMPSYPSARVEYPAFPAAAPQSNLSSLAGPNFFSGGNTYKEGQISVSSYPSVSFSDTTAASYPFSGFPFGSSCPPTSASFSGGSLCYPDSEGSGCFPAIPFHMITSGTLPSSYVRPHIMNPVGATGIESSGTWQKPNLDLNSGPEISHMGFKEERFFCKQDSLNNPVSLEPVETLCQPSAPGVLLKQKEFGGWDLHRSGYKQPWR